MTPEERYAYMRHQTSGDIIVVEFDEATLPVRHTGALHHSEYSTKTADAYYPEEEWGDDDPNAWSDEGFGPLGG